MMSTNKGRGSKGRVVPEKPAAPGEVNNFLGRSAFDRDFLYVGETRRAFTGMMSRMEWAGDRTSVVVTTGKKGLPSAARYTSPVVKCKFPATEFLPSWNIDLPDSGSQCYVVSVRVIDKAGKSSPWFFMGEGGNCEGTGDIKTRARGWGRTFIDYLSLEKPAAGFQYRVDFQMHDATRALPGLRRFFMHYSGEGRVPHGDASSSGSKMVRVKVPYRSQLDLEDPKLRDQVCCPTCVSMVLEQNGINEPTINVVNAVYNKRFDMHGIWPQASQAAYHYGFRAWVSRFRTMEEVRAYLETGHAIIASIRVGEGQLRHARYPKSNGHLIVITGLKKNKVLVNDPYSAGPKGAEIEYEREDIEKVWLDRGGVAILIESKVEKIKP